DLDPNGSLRIAMDTAQRMALMHSGRYRVWSLTWDDVQEQFRNQVPRFEAELLSPGAKLRPLLNSIDPVNAANWQGFTGLSSFGVLLVLLGAGRAWPWAQYARAYAVSLLEIDPAVPGRLRLHWERKHSDESLLLRAEGGMDAAG